jgi:hypothetical protein
MTQAAISQPQYLEKLAPRLRLLPPAARTKFEQLAQAQEEHSLIVRSISADLRGHIDRRHALQALVDEYTGKTGRYRPFPPDHPTLKQAELELEECRGAIARAQKNLEQKNRVGEPLGNLVYRLRGWLERLPKDRPIEPYSGAVKLPKGSSQKALDDIRVQIAEVAADLHRVTSAPLPSADAKKLVRGIVDELATMGAPNVSNLLDGIPQISWPIETPAHSRPVIGGHVVLGNENRGMLNFLAWLFPEQLAKRLQDEVELIADDSEALSPAERRVKEADLREQLLEMERIEEAIIEAIGPSCPRRPVADPRAVLGLADKLPGPAND